MAGLIYSLVRFVANGRPGRLERATRYARGNIVELIRHLEHFPPADRGGAVAIGNFDGVHRGHARLVERLLERAGELHGPAIVFTFDPHPVRLLRPAQAPPPLTWTDRKAALLRALGVDVIVAYATDERLLQWTPGEFFQEIVERQLGARAIVEGPNFYFGRNRSGNIETLARLCAASEISLDIVEPVQLDGQYVSSSRIRELVQRGEVGEAGQMLTEPYRVRGMVTHGAQRGMRIGFPTANLSAVDTLLPALGVYAGRAYTAGGRYAAAIHLGPSPTFGEAAVKVEVHLIDFHQDLYGQPLEVDFLARLRDIRPFADIAALKSQLAIDVSAAAQVCTTWR